MTTWGKHSLKNSAPQLLRFEILNEGVFKTAPATLGWLKKILKKVESTHSAQISTKNNLYFIALKCILGDYRIYHQGMK